MLFAPHSPALAQRLSPSKGAGAELLALVAGAALIGLLAQVRIELWPVPVTGQTLGVLLTGAFLGAWRGAAAAALYVALGAAGVPIFAGAGSGVAVLTGPTGGYLVGFVVSAGVIGYLAERGFLGSYRRAVLAMALASFPVLVLGVAWLLRFVPLERALTSGLLLVLPGASIKVLLASWIAVVAVRSARTGP